MKTKAKSTVRPVSFERAKAQYVHRFTMEHVPAWALRQFRTDAEGAIYYAPHFRTDREWYDSTLFQGESELADKSHCYTSGETWPLGRELRQPFRK